MNAYRWCGCGLKFIPLTPDDWYCDRCHEHPELRCGAQVHITSIENRAPRKINISLSPKFINRKRRARRKQGGGGRKLERAN